ncbi:MAG: carbon-nitrogen hydrolase family protein [Christensenellaceae bacterium]|nr:carbon-nitrogen hydrolase family protein [Christensenellaceae bacterium]
MARFKLALLQLPVSPNADLNRKRAEEWLKRAAKRGAQMAVLPEMFTCPYDTALFASYAESVDGQTVHMLQEVARVEGMVIVGGSFPEQAADGKVYNSCPVIDADGRLLAVHRKLHMFDIYVDGGQHFCESDAVVPGSEITVVSTKCCEVGVAVCYDIRFPELALSMAEKGAKLLVYPASFNPTTGPLHWELLFRARAMDCQAFTVGVASAAGQECGYTSYGHSIVCDPWGKVLLQMNEEEGLSVIEICLDEADRVRRQLPFLAHRRKEIY